MCSTYKLNKQGDNIQPLRTPFPVWNQSVFHVGSKCCFLTCIQVSQETGQVVWYSHLFKNFPQFVVLHTVEGFGIVNKVEVDVFLELSCFFYDPKNVGNLISGSSTFSKSSLNIWKFMVHILLKPSLKDFEHYLASMGNEYNCVVAWTFFGIVLLWDWNESWHFQSCGHCWVFQICWHTECSTFTVSSFRIWNSSTGIPSPPLALFIVMLPKAHLTSHSRMSGSRWVITPSWLSESLRTFLYSFSVYSCHLFLISSASVRSIPFLSFIKPIFAWNIPLVSLIFLRRSLVFTILLFSSISLHWSLRKAFLSLLAILWNSAFRWVYLSFSPLPFISLVFSAIWKASSDNHLPSWISFYWGWFWSLPPVWCYEPPSIVLQTFCLSDLIPWIYLSLLLYNRRGFYLGHTWMA